MADAEAENSQLFKSISIQRDSAHEQRILAEQWQEKYTALQAHHATSWLPHWMDETVGIAFASVGTQASGIMKSVKSVGGQVVEQGLDVGGNVLSRVSSVAKVG